MRQPTGRGGAQGESMRPPGGGRVKEPSRPRSASMGLGGGRSGQEFRNAAKGVRHMRGGEEPRTFPPGQASTTPRDRSSSQGSSRA